MANKLAIGALAAAAVAAAPALAQEAPSPSPGSHQALRVCVDAARENALEGCEELKKVLSNSAYQNAYLAQEVAIECVVLDGCLEADGPLIKVRPGSAGPQATQMIYCILRTDPYLRPCDPSLFHDTRAPAPARAKIPTQTGRRSCRGGAQGYPWGACAQGEAIIATPPRVRVYGTCLTFDSR